MKVSEIMTDEVYACRPQDCANEAARIMWEHDCGCVPIIDESDRVVGMVTDRDICMAAYTQGLPLSSICIQSLMPERAFCCQPEDSIETLEEIMMGHQIRRVAVVDQDNRLQGIVSLGDMAVAIGREAGNESQKPLDRMLIAETLATVSEPRMLSDQPVDMDGQEAPENEPTESVFTRAGARF